MAALRRDFDGRPVFVVAGIVGIAGAIGVALGFILEPERAFAGYLAAWCTAITIGIGGLCVLAIGYAANARWPAAVRRLGESISVGLLPTAILAIPMLVAPSYVWPWAKAGAEHEHAVAVKHAYLSEPFFIARTVFYLALFVIGAELLRAWSRRRDTAPEPQVPHGVDALNRERKLSSAILPVIGVAGTFASIDWLESLDPEWWSSAFGLYVLTGALLAGLAMVIFLGWRGVANGAMPLPPGVFHAMGRLLHAFVVLWTYIAYFQAMLIQIANKPNEVRFYVDRVGDGWRFVTALLVILKFALPFPLLLSRRLKRNAAYVGAIAVIILVGQYVDMWWLVIPRLESSPIPSWTDLAALCAIGGLVTCACAWRMRGSPLLPIGDPYLADALAYETSI